MPAHSASAASSVKSSRPSSAARRCAASRASNANACGVCTSRSDPRSIVASMVPFWPSRLTVSVTGKTGTAAPVFSAAAIARMIRSELANGRAASWTRTISGRFCESASSPARTDACRVAPPKTGGNIRISCVSLRTRSVSSRRTTGCTASMAGTLAKPSIERRIRDVPPIARNCFGKSPPARRPWPAATTTAATCDICVSKRPVAFTAFFSLRKRSWAYRVSFEQLFAPQHLQCDTSWLKCRQL